MANSNICFLPKFASIAKMTRASRVTFGGTAFPLLIVSIWKPVLILLLTSSGSPLGAMIGEFPERFTSKVECDSFIEGQHIDPRKSKLAIDGQAAEISGYGFGCVPDDAGQGV